MKFAIPLTSFVRLLWLLCLAVVLLALEYLVHYRPIGAVTELLLRLSAARRAGRRSREDSFWIFRTFLTTSWCFIRRWLAIGCCCCCRRRWSGSRSSGEPFVPVGFVRSHPFVRIPPRVRVKWGWINPISIEKADQPKNKEREDRRKEKKRFEFIVNRIWCCTYSRQRETKLTKTGSQFFKMDVKSLDPGLRFLPLLLVMQRGLPFESR